MAMMSADSMRQLIAEFIENMDAVALCDSLVEEAWRELAEPMYREGDGWSDDAMRWIVAQATARIVGGLTTAIRVG